MKKLTVVLTTVFLMILGHSALAETVPFGGDFRYESRSGSQHTIEKIEFNVAIDGLVSIESTSVDPSYMRLFDSSDNQIGEDNSFIEQELVAGDYMVTIGLAGYTALNALNGFDPYAIPNRATAWTVNLTTPSPVPVPAALPLFFSAVTGLLLVRRRKSA